MHPKQFRVQIYAYQYHADFVIESLDGPLDIENAIVDKLGKNDIVWEKDGFIVSSKLWLTYEETIDANTSQGPLQEKEGSRDRVGTASA